MAAEHNNNYSNAGSTVQSITSGGEKTDKQWAHNTGVQSQSASSFPPHTQPSLAGQPTATRPQARLRERVKGSQPPFRRFTDCINYTRGRQRGLYREGEWSDG